MTIPAMPPGATDSLEGEGEGEESPPDGAVGLALELQMDVPTATSFSSKFELFALATVN